MELNRLGVDELVAFMQARDIQGEILHLSFPTPTVEAAAQAVSASPEQIIKSILFMVDGQPVSAVPCGKSAIDRRAIADLYGVGKKRVKLAKPDIVLEISGYEVGAMPPFGHRQPTAYGDRPESASAPEKKAELAEALTRETVHVLGCAPEAVDIVCEDVKRSDWMTAGKSHAAT